MTIGYYRLLVASFLFSLVVIDRGWHVSLFSLVPLVLVVPILLTWHSARPLVGVLVWSGAALFLTTASPLLISGLALLPWAVRRALPRITVDVSLAFLLTLLITVLLQLGLVFHEGTVPWVVAVSIWLLVSGVAFVALLVAQQVSPHV